MSIDAGAQVAIILLACRPCVVIVNCLGQVLCDAPKPGGPLTTHQPAENLYISYHETHT